MKIAVAPGFFLAVLQMLFTDFLIVLFFFIVFSSPLPASGHLQEFISEDKR
jgi:hypothetical protein